MNKYLQELFNDKDIIEKIQTRLPYLFQIAELECSRAGKIGMEVGSMREKIITALLIYKFDEKNIRTDIPITQAEIDLYLYDNPISIKTISGNNLVGIKLIWTVDAEKAIEFSNSYHPKCDIILIQVNWNNIGYMFYFPLETQVQVLKEISINKYIKLPKIGTNPRGVEITREALTELVNNNETMKVEIEWKKTDIKFNPYKRWIDMWGES